MEPILYIGVAQFLFASLLTFSKPKKQLADIILGIWLLLMCIFMGLTLAKNGAEESFWGKLQLFPFFYTLGPFLLLYVRTLTAQKRRLEFEDGLHLLPFAVFSAVAVTQSHTVDEDILKGNILNANMLVYTVTSLLSLAYYLGATIPVLSKHRANLLDHFSYTSNRISLGWLSLVIFCFAATLLVTIFSILFNAYKGLEMLNPGIPLFLGLTLFGYGVTFFGVRQPAIFSKIREEADERFVDELDEDEVEIEDDDDVQQKYSRSGLQDETAARYLKRLMGYMEKEKPYLRRDLNIQDLANELDIPQHHLTQSINERLNKNFYTLVNEFRVEEVKKRLVDPSYSHLTVLAIAHDAGFNSKSSFNMTFKKIVGLTPSAYKRSIQNAEGEGSVQPG